MAIPRTARFVKPLLEAVYGARLLVVLVIILVVAVGVALYG